MILYGRDVDSKPSIFSAIFSLFGDYRDKDWLKKSFLKSFLGTKSESSRRFRRKFFNYGNGRYSSIILQETPSYYYFNSYLYIYIHTT